MRRRNRAIDGLVHPQHGGTGAVRRGGHAHDVATDGGSHALLKTRRTIGTNVSIGSFG